MQKSRTHSTKCSLFLSTILAQQSFKRRLNKPSFGGNQNDEHKKDSREDIENANKMK